MRCLSRRAFTLAGTGGVALSLSACSPIRDMPVFGALFEDWPRDGGPVRSPDYAKTYGRIEGEPFPVPAFDFTNTDPAFLRSNVGYRGGEPPGTIVVDRRQHMLYLVEEDGRATRYGIGVGPDGVGFSGEAVVGRREAWPDRRPSIARRGNGRSAYAQLGSASPPVPAEPGRPRLGARVLSLTAGAPDTVYVIHGTPEPNTIGADVPSGGVRLIDQDIIDLYRRTSLGSTVVVLG